MKTTTTSQSSATLARLLDDELVFSPSFRGYFSNHLAMALVALEQLGATADVLESVFDAHARESAEMREDVELLDERRREVHLDGIAAVVHSTSSRTCGCARHRAVPPDDPARVCTRRRSRRPGRRRPARLGAAPCRPSRPDAHRRHASTARCRFRTRGATVWHVAAHVRPGRDRPPSGTPRRAHGSGARRAHARRCLVVRPRRPPRSGRLHHPAPRHRRPCRSRR